MTYACDGRTLKGVREPLATETPTGSMAPTARRPA